MLTSDAVVMSRLTASRSNAWTSKTIGSLHADSSGASVKPFAPRKVSLRLVPVITEAPEPATPTNAAANTAGVLPLMFVSFTRNDLPGSVGRTTRRTELPSSPLTTSPTLCAAAHAENHRGSCADGANGAVAMTAAAATATTASVFRRRPLDMIDDHNISGRPARDQAETELLANRGEQRWTILAIARRDARIRCPTEREVERTSEAGRILHRPAKLIRQNSGQHVGGHPLADQRSAVGHLEGVRIGWLVTRHGADLRAARLAHQRVCHQVPGLMMHEQLEALGQQRSHHQLHLARSRLLFRRLGDDVEAECVESGRYADEATF